MLHNVEIFLHQLVLQFYYLRDFHQDNHKIEHVLQNFHDYDQELQQGSNIDENLLDIQ
jgi:hypothetical protein